MNTETQDTQPNSFDPNKMITITCRPKDLQMFAHSLDSLARIEKYLETEKFPMLDVSTFGTNNKVYLAGPSGDLARTILRLLADYYRSQAEKLAEFQPLDADPAP